MFVEGVHLGHRLLRPVGRRAGQGHGQGAGPDPQRSVTAGPLGSGRLDGRAGAPLPGHAGPSGLVGVGDGRPGVHGRPPAARRGDSRGCTPVAGQLSRKTIHRSDYTFPRKYPSSGGDAAPGSRDTHRHPKRESSGSSRSDKDQITERRADGRREGLDPHVRAGVRCVDHDGTAAGRADVQADMVDGPGPAAEEDEVARGQRGRRAPPWAWRRTGPGPPGAARPRPPRRPPAPGPSSRSRRPGVSPPQT